MFVTGGTAILGGGRIPQRIIVSSVPLSVLRIVGEDPRHWGEVSNVAIDHAEQPDDRFLTCCCDRIEIAHHQSRSPG